MSPIILIVLAAFWIIFFTVRSSVMAADFNEKMGVIRKEIKAKYYDRFVKEFSNCPSCGSRWFLLKGHVHGEVRNWTYQGLSPRSSSNLVPYDDDGEIICRRCGRVIMLEDPNTIRFEKDVKGFDKGDGWDDSDTGSSYWAGESLHFSRVFNTGVGSPDEVDQKIESMVSKQYYVKYPAKQNQGAWLTVAMILSFTLGIFLVIKY